LDLEKNIALLYFSRRAVSESKEKRYGILGNRLSNLAVAKTLISVSSNILSHSGLPVYHFHEGNQSGNTFGERIANAYADLFALGYKSVIAVGNDSPGIANIHWEAVCQSLEAGESVLGPSHRGGSYLIGLNVHSFNKSAFENLPWQTDGLYSAMHAFCSATKLGISILETFYDVNSANDLNKVIRNGESSTSFISLFAKMLFGIPSRILNFPDLNFSSPSLLIKSLRGPPIAA